jgi:NAD-reducing hydrogenase large subunit
LGQSGQSFDPRVAGVDDFEFHFVVQMRLEEQPIDVVIHQPCSEVIRYSAWYEGIDALERIESLLNDPQILETHLRAKGGVNALEGVGMIEAPPGLLIHHYKVNEEGGIVWANLIVATGHSNLAIGRSIHQVSEHFIDGTKLKEDMLNRVSAVVRAYDPCLSCSTHAIGQIPLQISLVGPSGELLDRLVQD